MESCFANCSENRFPFQHKRTLHSFGALLLFKKSMMALTFSCTFRSLSKWMNLSTLSWANSARKCGRAAVSALSSHQNDRVPSSNGSKLVKTVCKMSKLWSEASILSFRLASNGWMVRRKFIILASKWLKMWFFFVFKVLKDQLDSDAVEWFDIRRKWSQR